jgi:transcription initiation protein SPT3
MSTNSQNTRKNIYSQQLSNNNNNNSQQQQHQQQQQNAESKFKSKLFDEVAILMRAFGDVTDSSMQIRESVILVEKILIQQLKLIIESVNEICVERTHGASNVPHQIDFEFLMHRNKPKLMRFRKYMRNVQRVQCKSGEQKSHSGSGGNFGINFLNRLAEETTSDEEQETYDAEKIRRIYRADRISNILSPQKYEEFQKARSWSSNLRNKADFLRKIVEILQLPKEIQDSSNCLEIIQFLTMETIATIVDFSLLTRLTSENLESDSSVVNTNLSSSEMLTLCPEVTQGRGFDGIKPIKVQEIQEAMRRVQQMHQSRKLSTSRIALLAL